MRSEYSKILSDYMQGHGVPNALPSPVIAAADLRLIRVGFPSQGRLTGVDIRQSDAGAAVAFTADILKSKLPFAVDTDLPVATVANVPISSLRICPQIIGLAGASGTLASNSEGYSFRNIDGGFTNNQRFIYVLIVPAGAVAPTSWDIVLTCELVL